jgi:hypothetical protein
MIYKFNAKIFHVEPGLISIDLGNNVLLKIPVELEDCQISKGSTVTVKVEIPSPAEGGQVQEKVDAR